VKKHLRFRRPSAALIIASLALFASLGGVGYAAISLPRNSVGTNQIRNNAVHGSKINVLSVGFRKIQFGAVGIRRINTNQVQARVNGTCAANSAMTAVDDHGNVTCAPTAPKEFGATSSGPITINTTATTVTSKVLPGGSSYLVFANPQVDVSGAAGAKVQVDCTLGVIPGDASTSSTRTVTIQGDAGHQLASMSLMVPAPAVANGSTAQVACTRTSAGTPTVTVATSINALQTASNG
jgi:hypothetical protein